MEEAISGISTFRGSGSKGGSDFGIEIFKLPVREILREKKSSRKVEG
jgi:hypothetical protein